jgi:hypothetical protein
MRNRIVMAMFTAFVVVSCHDAASWYPAGTVELAGFSEYEDSLGDRYCAVNLKAVNTGQSRILKTTVSVKLVTDAETYYRTVESDLSILPGKSVFVSLTVPYYANTETTAEDKITIEDSFFE